MSPWPARTASTLKRRPSGVPAQGRSDLIPGQPKKGGNPNQGPDAGGPSKGNITTLYRGLGLDFDLSNIIWSDYTPSHEFRQLIPVNFVWTSRDQQGIKEANATTGLTGLLLPFPGQITEAKDKPAALTVKPLFTPTPRVTWGRDLISELTQSNPYGGGLQFKEPKHLFSGDRSNPPALAVEVTGTMNAAYPVIDPNAKAPEAKAGEPAPAAPEKKTGVPSSKPIKVIVIADVDFVNNAFFEFYRNAGNQFNQKEELKFLLDLRNVQLAANAVDALFDDAAFLELRTKRPERRPLKRLEDQLLITQESLRKAGQNADAEAQSAIAAAQKSFDDELAKIDAREDLDDNAKAHEKAGVQVREQRKVDLAMAAINEAKEGKMREAKIEQRRQIDAYRQQVKILAIGIPAVVLALLVLAVFLRKVAAETAHVPTARKRAAV